MLEVQEHYERANAARARLDRYFAPWSTIAVTVWVCAFISGHAALVFVLMAWVAVGGAGLLVVGRPIRTWDARVWAVPMELRDRAIALYGPEDDYVTAVECHECHLPGDCPLCGAK